MKTASQPEAATGGNIIPLAPPPKPAASKPPRTEPFKVKSFINPRTGTTSWRVDGFNRAGKRIRENFTDLVAAQCRQVELIAEWLQKERKTTARATKLSDSQLRIAED